MNIITVSYHSTHYYIIDAPKGMLLVDAGWPGTWTAFNSLLQAKRIHISAIKYLLVTHYHPDHAGLVEELKDAGLQWIVLEQQVDYIPLLRKYIKDQKHYKEIRLNDALLLKTTDSKQFLESIGINGTIIHTPGHSEDSVTLVLDNGIAFTGDLPPAALYTDNKDVVESWNKITALGVHTAYPAHGASIHV